jgi:hypothetical protein
MTPSSAESIAGTGEWGLGTTQHRGILDEGLIWRKSFSLYLFFGGLGNEFFKSQTFKSSACSCGCETLKCSFIVVVVPSLLVRTQPQILPSAVGIMQRTSLLSRSVGLTRTKYFQTNDESFFLSTIIIKLIMYFLFLPEKWWNDKKTNNGLALTVYSIVEIHMAVLGHKCGNCKRKCQKKEPTLMHSIDLYREIPSNTAEFYNTKDDPGCNV